MLGEINGTPILGLWLNKLNNLGCDEVLVNTHYLHEKVEDYLSLSFNNMKKKYERIAGTAEL